MNQFGHERQVTRFYFLHPAIDTKLVPRRVAHSPLNCPVGGDEFVRFVKLQRMRINDQAIRPVEV